MVEIIKKKDTTYNFLLKSKDGFVLLNSINYSEKITVEKVIASLAFLITHQNAFERKTNSQGKFYFNLKDIHQKIIGNSLLYTSEAGLENGIVNLKNSIQEIS
ncbi:MAG: YegP family protein [Cellulophaga sp.]